MNSLVVWTAGFFDGEGCIRIEVSRRGRHKIKPCLVVTIAQRHECWLTPIQERWGGHVKPDRGCHSLRLKSLAAERFLKAVRPHLRVKREQVDVALEYRRKFIGKHRGRGHGYSDSEVAELTRLIGKLTDLKHP